MQCWRPSLPGQHDPPAQPGQYEAEPPAVPGGRGHPHHPRGGRRVRAPGAAVLRRQGLDRHAAPGHQGVRAGPGAVPGHARRHRPQLRRGASPPATSWSTGTGVRLVVASVAGRHRRRPGGRQRSVAQPAADGDAAARDPREPFDAAFGGARRDEEKARAKERVFSFRDEFGQWDPKAQRPELWNLYNGRHRKGEHIRVFPLSNWTEYDIWAYIGAEGIELAVHLLRAPPAGVPARRNAAGRPRISAAHADEEVFETDGAVPHRRRRDLHRMCGVDGGRRSTR